MKAIKRIIGLAVFVGAVALAWQQLSDSKQRFLNEFLRQVPYLIPRYYV